MFRRLELLCLASLLAAVGPGCVSWSDDAAFACGTDADCPQGSCVDGTCAAEAGPPACTVASCEGLCGDVADGCGGTHRCSCNAGESCFLTPGTAGGVCGAVRGCENYCNDVPDGLGGTISCECGEGLHCNAERPTVGECCQPLACDAAHECGVFHDDCTGQDVPCGCADPGSRCAGFPGSCEPCGCAAGEVCRPDGSCTTAVGPRCWGDLREVRELSDGEENAGGERNQGFPSLSFASKEGATWLYFLTGRWQQVDLFFTEFAEVRLTSATSADAATLARIPLDSGGFKYHVSAAPDASELFLSSGAPGGEGWQAVRVFHALPLQGGGWSVPEPVSQFGVRDSDPINGTLLPDRRTVLYADGRNPFSAKAARRPSTDPSDVAFQGLGAVTIDPAPRWWPNGPSCDGLGLYYVADSSDATGVDLQPRYAPILANDPLTFGQPEQLSVPGLPTVRAGIALAETPDCAALWLWVDGRLYAAPRIPCP